MLTANSKTGRSTQAPWRPSFAIADCRLHGVDTCVHIPPAGLRVASWNTTGFWAPQPQLSAHGKGSTTAFGRLSESSDIVCLQETHGQMEFLRAFVHCSVSSRVGILIGDLDICEPEYGRFDEASHTFSDGDPGGTAVFRSTFPHALEIAPPNCTRKDVSADGILRTLLRIDRAFINIPMAEARDFRCRTQTVDYFRNRSLPCDHTAIRFTIQKPTSGVEACGAIQSWITKHLCFFCSSLIPMSMYAPMMPSQPLLTSKCLWAEPDAVPFQNCCGPPRQATVPVL